MSFWSCALLVAVLSTGIVWLFCAVLPKDLRNLWIVVVPFAVSFCLYWTPVWFGGRGSEYDKAVLKSEYLNWELIFLVPWFFAGAIPSAVMVGILAILRKRRARQRSSASVAHCKLHIGFSLLLLIFAVHGASGQGKPCTKAEHLQVEKEADTFRSWDALYKSFRRYGHCDDVEAQEGYSESIARILADHWETLPRLADLIDKDKSFGGFVALNATMNMNDVEKIRAYSISRCPDRLATICAKLRKDADDALAEDAGQNP